MASWAEFAEADPELAAFGAERFQSARVAYLANVRPDGSPRVHPVTPIIGGGRLFLFIGPSSPKGRDLRGNAGYALHSLVTDEEGTPGEFSVRGEASLVDDAGSRAVASAAAGYTILEDYLLFELALDGASSTLYRQGGPKRKHWGKR